MIISLTAAILKEELKEYNEKTNNFITGKFTI